VFPGSAVGPRDGLASLSPTEAGRYPSSSDCCRRCHDGGPRVGAPPTPASPPRAISSSSLPARRACRQLRLSQRADTGVRTAAQPCFGLLRNRSRNAAGPRVDDQLGGPASEDLSPVSSGAMSPTIGGRGGADCPCPRDSTPRNRASEGTCPTVSSPSGSRRKHGRPSCGLPRIAGRRSGRRSRRPVGRFMGSGTPLVPTTATSPWSTPTTWPRPRPSSRLSPAGRSATRPPSS
jgi:hypothetical protein